MHGNETKVDEETFNRTLFAALDALQESRIPFALIGGVAASGLGRPRATQDIDVFVKPEDADKALEGLARKGFSTEKRDPTWLYKAFSEDILVDIIFKSKGDIYLDQEMISRAQLIDYHGRKVRAVAPEDLVIIKAAVHEESGPHHWHDALSILSHANLDWDYLIKRARRAPRRVLALLLYAQSNDVWIPNRVIYEIFKSVFGDMSGSGSITIAAPANAPAHVPAAYVAARVHDALARDPRSAEQDIKVFVAGNHIVLRGEACTQEHRLVTEEVAKDAAPDFVIQNQITVKPLPGPEAAEDVG